MGQQNYPATLYGFVEGKHLHHPNLIAEERSRMKIMLFDAENDLPIALIESLLNQALDLYRSGTIKIKGK